MRGRRSRGQVHPEPEGRPCGIGRCPQTYGDGDRLNEVVAAGDQQAALHDQADQRHGETEEPGESRAHHGVQSRADHDHDATKHDQVARKLRHDDGDGQDQDRGNQDERGDRRQPLSEIQLAA